MAVLSNLIQQGYNAFAPLFAQGQEQFGQMNEDLLNETTQEGWQRHQQLKAQAGQRPTTNVQEDAANVMGQKNAGQPQQPPQQPGQGQYPQGYQGPRAPTDGQGMSPQAYRNPSNIPGLASMSSPGPGPPRKTQWNEATQAGLDKGRKSVLTSAGRMDAVRNNVIFEFQKAMEKQHVDDPNSRQIATEEAIGKVLKRLAKDPALAMEFLMVPTGGGVPAMTQGRGRGFLEGDLRNTLKEYSGSVPGDTGEPWERQVNPKGRNPDVSRFIIRPPAAEVQQELAQMYAAYEETERFGRLLTSPGVLGDQAREEQELDRLRREAGRPGYGPIQGGLYTNAADMERKRQRRMSGMDQVGPARGPKPESSADVRPMPIGPVEQPGYGPGILNDAVEELIPTPTQPEQRRRGGYSGVRGGGEGYDLWGKIKAANDWEREFEGELGRGVMEDPRRGGRGSYSGVRGGGGQRPDWKAMPGKARDLLEKAWESITGKKGLDPNAPEQTNIRPEHESETAIDAMLAAMLMEEQPLDEAALEEESPEALAEALRQLIESSQRNKGMP